jgi:hypothetical protein
MAIPECFDLETDVPWALMNEVHDLAPTSPTYMELSCTVGEVGAQSHPLGHNA